MAMSASAVSAVRTLPRAPDHVIGRDDVIAEISRRVNDRLVSIVGPGGVGKTTVAVAVASALDREFAGAVHFVELSALDDPKLVEPTVAAAFDLPVQAGDPVPALVSHLQGRRTLLVLDCCERVVSSASALVTRLLQRVPGLHIMTTSRQALGATGEDVVRLPPLEMPPDSPNISSSAAATFPAVQLFVQRAAGGVPAVLTDDLAPLVTRICRKLGGLPLAIELVAAQTRDHGVRETMALLDSQFALRWSGGKVASPRHRTLNATLDWSYNLLSESERSVLRQLSVFSGGFTMDAACGVVRADKRNAPPVDEVVASLVAKSLVSPDNAPAGRYRLLDSTRAYAALKLTDRAERHALNGRHALYFCEWLKRTAADATAARRELGLMRSETDNVRVALDWAFAKGGDRVLAVDLSVATAPLWLGQALFAEGRDWMLKAMTALPDEGATQQRLAIQLTLATVDLFSSGLSPETAGSWIKALELAEHLGDPTQFTCFLVVWGWETRETWYGKALETGKRCANAARALHADAGTVAMGDWMVGHIQHHLGLLEDSRVSLQRALVNDVEAARLAQISTTGYDRKVDGLSVLSNTLWTQGAFDEARRMAAKAVAEARSLGTASPFGVAMTWAGLNNYLAACDVAEVERDMRELVDHGRAHSLKSEEGFGLCVLGLCEARRGAYEAGAPSVEKGLHMLVEAHMSSFNPLILAHLAQAAILAGRPQDAHAAMARLAKEDRNEEHWCTPEILRVKAAIAAAAGDAVTGESLLNEALAVATRHGAHAWRLKIATDLARSLFARECAEDARRVLEPICAAVTEGSDTADVRAAKRVLRDLSAA